MVSAACIFLSISISLFPKTKEMIKETITAIEALNDIYLNTPAPGKL
jgi:hypothetical protein